MAANSFIARFWRELRTFAASKRGNVAIIFGICAIPLMTGVGAAVDYSRANAAKSAVQAALDAALLAGAKDGGSATWKTVATNVFNSNISAKDYTPGTPSFTTPEAMVYEGNATGQVQTAMLGIVGYHTLTVTATGRATAAEADNSCILTLDKG